MASRTLQLIELIVDYIMSIWDYYPSNSLEGWGKCEKWEKFIFRPCAVKTKKGELIVVHVLYIKKYQKIIHLISLYKTYRRDAVLIRLPYRKPIWARADDYTPICFLEPWYETLESIKEYLYGSMDLRNKFEFKPTFIDKDSYGTHIVNISIDTTHITEKEAKYLRERTKDFYEKSYREKFNLIIPVIFTMVFAGLAAENTIPVIIIPIYMITFFLIYKLFLKDKQTYERYLTILEILDAIVFKRINKEKYSGLDERC